MHNCVNVALKFLKALVLHVGPDPVEPVGIEGVRRPLLHLIRPGMVDQSFEEVPVQKGDRGPLDQRQGKGKPGVDSTPWFPSEMETTGTCEKPASFKALRINGT